MADEIEDDDESVGSYEQDSDGEGDYYGDEGDEDVEDDFDEDDDVCKFLHFENILYIRK